MPKEVENYLMFNRTSHKPVFRMRALHLKDQVKYFASVFYFSKKVTFCLDFKYPKGSNYFYWDMNALLIKNMTNMFLICLKDLFLMQLVGCDSKNILNNLYLSEFDKGDTIISLVLEIGFFHSLCIIFEVRSHLFWCGMCVGVCGFSAYQHSSGTPLCPFSFWIDNL